MTQAKYTSGPWRFKGFDPEFNTVPVINSGSYDLGVHFLGTHGLTNEEKEANAHLIAAAPDLFDALQNIMNGITSGAIKTDYDEVMENAVIRAHKAIAKAKGAV